MLAQYTN